MSRPASLRLLLAAAAAAAAALAACGGPDPLDGTYAGGATGGTAGDQTAAGAAGTGGAGGAGGEAGGMPPPPPPDAGMPPPSVCNGGPLPPLAENRGVYAPSNVDVWTLYVTAPDTQALADVNADVPGAQAAVIFQQGEFGAGLTQPNAIMEVRGRSTRRTDQKSFQITLNSHDDLWHGYRHINLNKHPYDLTRVRNKLAFDTFQTIPGFTSLRTQFVHLFVNGDDYGLFTQIEGPDGRFLAAHGLDPNGTLYKANNFYWQPIDDATVADPAMLDAVVENKNAPDLARLQQTIADINDLGQNINDVVARHFERQNYMTWVAVNLLTGNFDTVSQNYIAYSPAGCAGWYLLPWDYDGAFEWYEQPGDTPRPRWRAGLSAWYEVPLFARFIRDPANLRDLDARITELAQSQLSDDAARPRLAAYHDVVQAFVSALPDVTFLPTFMSASNDENVVQWQAEYTRMDGVFARRYAEYRATLGRPMPVWLYEAMPGDLPGDAYTFTWSSSYMPGSGNFSYDLEVAPDATFDPATLVVQQRGLRQAIAMVTVPPGTWYWRVVIRSDAQPDVDWQIPFDQYEPFTVAP